MDGGISSTCSGFQTWWCHCKDLIWNGCFEYAWRADVSPWVLERRLQMQLLLLSAGKPWPAVFLSACEIHVILSSPLWTSLINTWVFISQLLFVSTTLLGQNICSVSPQINSLSPPVVGVASTQYFFFFNPQCIFGKRVKRTWYYATSAGMLYPFFTCSHFLFLVWELLAWMVTYLSPSSSLGIVHF